MPQFKGILRVKHQLLPGVSPGERTLSTHGEFTTKEAAQAHCEKLMATGMFSLYRVMIRHKVSGGLSDWFYTDISVEADWTDDPEERRKYFEAIKDKPFRITDS